LDGVGKWPELRAVRRVWGIGMPVIRLVGATFLVFNLQKIVGVHEGRVEGGQSGRNKGGKVWF
jgi:hypothetical protein